MIKCLCCNAEIGEEQMSCPVCGLPTLGEAPDEYIAELRKERLSGITVDAVVHSYDVEGSSVNELENEYIRLASAEELVYNDVKWFSEEFEPLDTDEPFSVELCITNKDGNKNNVSVELVPEGTVSRTFMGIILSDGFSIKLAAGNSSSYITSETVSLVQG